MACEIKVYNAIKTKIEELSADGLDKQTLSEANLVADRVNSLFKEDVVKFVKKKPTTFTNIVFKDTVKSVINGSVNNVDTKFTDSFYELLSEKSLVILSKNNINKDNFNSAFNSELQKTDEKSNWFTEILNEIKKFLGKPNLKSIIDSTKSENVGNFFNDKGDLLLYGITSNQKTKIPLINNILYKAFTPFSYNTKFIRSNILSNLIIGRNYKDHQETFLKYGETVTDPLEKKTFENIANITEEQFNNREDAFRISNGLPQLHNTFSFVGKGFLTEDGEIIESELGENVFTLNNPSFTEKGIVNGNQIDTTNYIMGKYGLKKGKDEKGFYIQYTDKWDLSVSNPLVQKVIDITQKPFLITGKIYTALSYDDNFSPFTYYTFDENSKDIQSYNEMIDDINIQELLLEDYLEDTLPPCF